MQVQYQLTIDDLVAFNLHHTRTSQASRRRIRRSQVYGVITVLIVVLLWPRWGLGLRAAFFVGYSLFLLFGFPAYYRWSVRRNAKKLYSGGGDKGALGNHIVSIDEGGVTEVSDVGDSRTTWGGIEKVEEDEAYIFVYTGSVQAHVIPKRAFLSDDEAAEFLETAKAYHSGQPRLTRG
jgi:hypothetical protein